MTDLPPENSTTLNTEEQIALKQAEILFTQQGLYKQYAEGCEPGGGQFINVGIAPDINRCIDGFMLIDVTRLKISPYKG